MKCLYLPIMNMQHKTQLQQKCGLREALAKYFKVEEFDYKTYAQRHGFNEMHKRFTEIMEVFQPDLLLTQFHNTKFISPQVLRRCKQVCPTAVMVNFNGDVWLKNLTSQDTTNIMREFDLVLTVNQAAIEPMRKNGLTVDYWDQGWEPHTMNVDPDETTPRHDVLFQGSGYSDKRKALGKALLSLREKNIDVGLYGNWPKGWASGFTLYDFDRQGQLTRAAKIHIGDQQWPEYPYVSSRLFNALAAGGSMVFQQRFAGCEGAEYGLIDGENCILWDDIDHLTELIEYWLKPARRGRPAKIAAAGQALAFNQHTFDHRVRELLTEILPKHAGKA